MDTSQLITYTALLAAIVLIVTGAVLIFQGTRPDGRDGSAALELKYGEWGIKTGYPAIAIIVGGLVAVAGAMWNDMNDQVTVYVSTEIDPTMAKSVTLYAAVPLVQVNEEPNTEGSLEYHFNWKPHEERLYILPTVPFGKRPVSGQMQRTGPFGGLFSSVRTVQVSRIELPDSLPPVPKPSQSGLQADPSRDMQGGY